jgi:hypothetical protein
MGSLEFAPPYPCCGGLIFHAGGEKCDEYRYPDNAPARQIFEPSIWDLVIADARARDKAGIQEYGAPLRKETPIDALRYAYEEALDLAVYLRKAIAERDGK